MIAIAVIITTILEHIIAYVKEIPDSARKATQAVKSTTTKISRNKLFQNIKKSYKTAVLAITIATNTIKLNASMKDHTSWTHPGPTMIFTTSTTSCKTVSDILCKDRIRTRKHPNTKL